MNKTIIAQEVRRAFAHQRDWQDAEAAVRAAWKTTEEQQKRILELEAEIKAAKEIISRQECRLSDVNGEILRLELDNKRVRPLLAERDAAMIKVTKLEAQIQAAQEQEPVAGALTGTPYWRPIETAPTGARGYAWMNLAWGPDEDKTTATGMRWGGSFFACTTFHALGQEKAFWFREVEVKPTHWAPLLAWADEAERTPGMAPDQKRAAEEQLNAAYRGGAVKAAVRLTDKDFFAIIKNAYIQQYAGGRYTELKAAEEASLRANGLLPATGAEG